MGFGKSCSEGSFKFQVSRGAKPELRNAERRTEGVPRFQFFKGSGSQNSKTQKGRNGEWVPFPNSQTVQPQVVGCFGDRRRVRAPGLQQQAFRARGPVPTLGVLRHRQPGDATIHKKCRQKPCLFHGLAQSPKLSIKAEKTDKADQRPDCTKRYESF